MPRRFADIYEDATLFSPNGPSEILHHRLDSQGKIEFLAIWPPGMMTRKHICKQYLTQLKRGQALPKDFRGKTILGRYGAPFPWKTHWTPSTPGIARSEAVRRYTERRRLPAPALGHPLPPDAPTTRHLTINLTASDPDTKIAASQDASIHFHHGLHHVYDAAGHLRGRISTARVKDLWRRFHAARPGLPAHMQHSFEHEVCNLLRRLITGAKSSARKVVEVTNHWATNQQVLSANLTC